MNKRTLYKRLLVGALALAVVATAVYGVAHRPGTARAAATILTYGEALCTHNTDQCLDLKGDVYKTDNPIILYGVNWNEDRFRWNLAFQRNVRLLPTPWPWTAPQDQTLDTNYLNRPVYYIEKKTPTGHNGCVGMNSDASNNLAWEKCGGSNFVANDTLWVQTGDLHYVNVGYSATVGAEELMGSGFSGSCSTANNASLWVGGCTRILDERTPIGH
jgi:hypothetical protein